MARIDKGDFAHLHLHTEYSLLDGACRIDRLMDRVKQLGQTAVAITDHGVMYGCVDFYKAAKKAGIKPIIGCEVYVSQRSRFDKVYRLDSSSYHLVLLCKNEVGYRNLIKLVSLSNTEGFYVKPRIDHELLERYSEGLVALSACLAGEIPQSLLAGDYERAGEIARGYRDLFGAENYYIELQDHGIEEQRRILPDLIRLARENGIGLVATNDCHYIEPSDSEMQHALICIQTNHTVDEAVLEFETNNFYLRSTEEMAELFASVPEAVTNTKKIADQCSFDFEFGVTKLPYFSTPDGSDNLDYFKKLCLDGLKKRYGARPRKAVGERLSYEMSVIERMGYVDYFLIVWDFINYARSHDIPVGPGRGSGAGSLCAYCMGITGIDPIKYNLIFERFLNPERVSMPDFDVDFCYEKRPLVIDYVVEKYGGDHVAQIITFGTMAARAAIRDVGRVLAIPYADVDRVAKLIPQTAGGVTIEAALGLSAELKALYGSDPTVKKLIDLSIKVEGMPRHASTHAAGVVITRNVVSDYVPLQKNDEQTVTQFTMTTLEELGLLKIDFLGLRTLTVVSDCEREIKKREPGFSMEKISFEDKETFDMLAAGDTSGVFQFESGGMRQVLVNLRPINVEDLIAVISLYRPGPMDSIPTYIDNRHHPDHIRYKTEKLKPILEVTNGCIVYQEQVMQIFRQLAGFSFGQADLVRRAMSKKKHAVMEQEGRRFIYGSEEQGRECAGCLKNGIPEPVAKDIYSDMANFASYAFNKSHAAAYAVVAYETAYLKCHYPVEFMAALLTSVLDNTDKVIEYITECQRIGIEVLPPDINVSSLGFTVDGKKIRFGLLAIKNVGRTLIESIERERGRKGQFVSFLDFCERMQGTELNRRALENLVKCGGFDGFGHTRKSMATAIEGVLKDIGDEHKRNLSGQIDLFDSLPEHKSREAALPDLGEYDKRELLTMEKELTGLYISSHPLKEYEEQARRISRCTLRELLTDDSHKYDNINIDLLCSVSSVRVKLTKSNQTMAYVVVEDMTGAIEMMVFQKILEQYSDILKPNSVVVVNARVSVREDEAVKLICNEVSTLESFSARRSGKSFRPENAPSGLRPGGPPPENSGGKKLFLRLEDMKGPRFERVKALITIFEGEIPVVARSLTDGKSYALRGRVSPDPALLAALESLLGKGNLVLR